MSADELASEMGRAAADELASAHQRIRHCVGQLSDAQVWWRERPDMNSIGNLILHLAGNVRQWIVAGLGGQIDVRNRPLEFAERGPIARADLLLRLDSVVGDARAVLLRLNAEQLVARTRIQGFHVSALEAIFNSIPHFRGHTQEIVHLTRVQLGENYAMAWEPRTPEEGAAP